MTEYNVTLNYDEFSDIRMAVKVQIEELKKMYWLWLCL